MAQERSGIAVGLNKGHVRSPLSFLCFVQAGFWGLGFSRWSVQVKSSREKWGIWLGNVLKTVRKRWNKCGTWDNTGLTKQKAIPVLDWIWTGPREKSKRKIRNAFDPFFVSTNQLTNFALTENHPAQHPQDQDQPHQGPVFPPHCLRPWDHPRGCRSCPLWAPYHRTPEKHSGQARS